MNRLKFLTVLIISVVFAIGCALLESRVDLESIYLVSEYDPERNPFTDLEQAVVEAEKNNKHILLEIGGDWCVWCHILDDFFQNKPKVAAALQQNYVVIKVNFSDENYNEAFLSQFPPAAGYPHFYILNQHGELLHSQNTAELEEGRSYNDEVFLAFLEDWRPQ